MNPNFLPTLRRTTAVAIEWLKQAFDVTATWVTQLSWWKFFLFAILVMIAGAIIQEILFSSHSDFVVIEKKKSADRAHKIAKSFSDGETNVQIDHSGIHITKKKSGAAGKESASDDADTDLTIDHSGIHIKEKKAASAGDESGTNITDGEKPEQSAPPVPPAPPAKPATPSGKTDLHITLPPEVGQEVSNAIDEAVDDAAEQKVERYRKKSSEWFMNFVILLVLGLFGTKALMGGKKRAEAQAAAANAAAEREALQRQVSEAKMQMMQAQVEPHFLFNTLASVEHLIETDPPRASAMQRSLIQYLRAVLPQMRENAAITNLGREADMVRAYLDLLKMRMEERLNVDFNVPDGLRSAAFPPMMLQSLVENAITHGLESKAQGGTLRVLAEVAHNRLRVTVSDDGLGFGAITSNGTGLGLQNIRERLKLLHGAQAQLIITPNTPSGVSATIEVPYRLAN